MRLCVVKLNAAEAANKSSEGMAYTNCVRYNWIIMNDCINRRGYI